MYTFLPQWLASKINLCHEDVCYAMKLTNIMNRRASAPAGGMFSGLMSGIGNAISDTLSSAMNSTYLLRFNSGEICVISEKTSPVRLSAQEVCRSIEFESGEIKIAVTFSQGEIESASLKLEAEKLNDSFCGDFCQFINDFDLQPVFPHSNLLDKFVSVIFSVQEIGDSIYKFKSMRKTCTLISYDDRHIYLHNEKRKIDFNNIITYRHINGYYAFLVRENNRYELIEIFDELSSQADDMEMNLVRDISEMPASRLQLCMPENILNAESFLSAFELNGLALAAVDNNIYLCKGTQLEKCGIFKIDSDIYVTTAGGVTEKYAGCEKITEVLSLLPAGYDNIFLEQNIAQPFIINSEICTFTAGEESLRSGLAVYEYAKMNEYSYVTDDFSCKIHFIYDNTSIEMTTANSLGVYVSNRQEKVYTTTEIKEYSINRLYDCYYKRFTKNFLASTFAEIYKTEKLLNNDISVNDIINAMREEGDVLRGVFKSFVGKFKNVEDLQSDLMQKVALLEIQRKKIQKLYDEWTLYYPHYMATLQVAWLKKIFGNSVNSEMLNTEYWKCVAQLRRALSSCNSYVQKSMSEIGMCIGKLSSALPREVVRADITQNLRITSNSKETMLKAGSDIMAGVAAGLEITNIFLRGYSATSPLTLSMSAKMLVDSYTKDVEMRKNVKAFGMQSLEWWVIFMKGIRVHIMEASNAVNEYNKLCLKRDTELFKKLPEDKRNAVMTKLSGELKGKILDGIDDKFKEIMPQFNLRISNIIEEIDGNSEFCNMTIDEFKNNLFI